MKRRCCVVLTGLVVSLALAPAAFGAYTPGSRSLGDPLLPLLGNGGYDAQHYDLTIDYDPVANSMTSVATITARATQDLSEFTLDFRGLTVTAVTVDGAAATVAREADKLVITPAQGIDNGATFAVVVAYNGIPQRIQDPDQSFEGWLRAPDGAFVVNEPMGAMSWFPNNNHPLDKALYDFHLTVPSTHVALGNGELASKVVNPNGTTTWNWHHTYPMATYLSTATVGLFDYTQSIGATALGAGGNPLQLYNAIDSSWTATQRAQAVATIAREDATVKFLSDIYGPYPFDSAGAVVDRLSGVGYVLEVQTKVHFPTNSVSANTMAHELTHQWFGDSVTLKTWGDIWLNEGWATWSQWHWTNKQNNGITPAQQFLNNYNSTQQPSRWNIPTAMLPDASELFNTFPVYTRGAMTLEALHQILGEPAFFELARSWVTERRYGHGNTADFIAHTKRIAREKAGFVEANVAKLDTLFQQWLYTSGKPTMTPANFFLRTDAPPVDVSGTVPGTLSLSIGPPVALGAFTPGVAREYTASTTANATSTAGDAALTVADPSATAPGRLVNGAFALPQPLEARVAPGEFGALSDSPLALKAYAGPFSNDAFAIDFRQSIGATDALRTGTYAKTVVFTLSTTTP